MFEDKPRLAREYQTIVAMFEIYCRDQHAGQDGLCPECQELLDYAYERLEKCPFQEEKSTCANCRVHCYKPDMRERMRVMMRTAGPKMMWRHPVLALLHLRDGRRKPPVLERRRTS